MDEEISRLQNEQLAGSSTQMFQCFNVSKERTGEYCDLTKAKARTKQWNI